MTAAVLERDTAFLGVERSLSGRRWRERAADPEVTRGHQVRLGLSEPISRALAARGVSVEAGEHYLRPTFKALFPDPSSFADMDLAARLIVDALAMARDGGHVGLGAIFHSDRGTQYTSAEFHQYCQRIRVRTSVGRTGVCWDNAVAESFFSALKNEMFHHRQFSTRVRARFAVADYIEVFYNRRRLHSTLGYRTPHEALIDYRTAATAA